MIDQSPSAINLISLSDLSDEFHLILDVNLNLHFSNYSFKTTFASVFPWKKSTAEVLGINVAKMNELQQQPGRVILFAIDVSLQGELHHVQWRAQFLDGHIYLSGTHFTNQHLTEGEKFAQALNDGGYNENHADYTGRLTEIQRVLANEVDKFKLISENVSDIVCLHEPREARYVYVSPSCKEVTGYTPAEMEGRSPYDFFHPEMIKALEEDHRKREAGELPADAPTGPPPKMIYLFKTKDKGFRWMESHSRPVFDKQGNVVLILSTSRDVHERIIAEREKEEYINYYRILGNNIPNGAVFLIDRNYNYLIAEGEEFEKLGRTSDYYVGKNARDIYTEDRYKKLSYYFEKLFAGESVSFEWDFNNQHYIFLGKPCIEKDGTIKTAILLTQNITDSKLQSLKLNKTLAELEAKNFELDSFVYRTSHDLRSPLASILGLADLILMEKELSSIYECTIHIRDSVKKLDTTINSILEYSRNDNLEILNAEVNLTNLWKQCVEVHNNMPGANRITFLCDGDGEEKFMVDPFRIQIIFNNLISNSIKYHDQAKENLFIRLSVRKSINGLQLTIADNGLGISKEHIPRVFNMFYRGNKLSQGAGLGLYIVKQAVDKLGGVLMLDSEEGRGTTFSITIPLQNQ
nr:PAS domain-containing sensor histidine kinase [Cyclobacteriaceae bacterium]